MLENLKRSGLASLGLQARAQEEAGEAGVAMSEGPARRIVDLRGTADDKAFLAAAKTALGLDLPLEAGGTAGDAALRVFWLGPDEWWILCPEEAEDPAPKLAKALAGQHVAITDVGESRTCIRVSGPKARMLLEKGCPLDLHARNFGAGRCAGTVLAKAAIVLHQTDDGPTYEVYVLRSFSEYLWMWLEDGAREYGFAVLAS